MSATNEVRGLGQAGATYGVAGFLHADEGPPEDPAKQVHEPLRQPQEQQIQGDLLHMSILVSFRYRRCRGAHTYPAFGISYAKTPEKVLRVRIDLPTAGMFGVR